MHGWLFEEAWNMNYKICCHVLGCRKYFTNWAKALGWFEHLLPHIVHNEAALLRITSSWPWLLILVDHVWNMFKTVWNSSFKSARAYICVPIGQPCSPALSSAPANCNLANPSKTKLFSQHFIFWQFSTNMFTFAILLRVSPPTCFPFFSTFLKYFRPVLNTQTHFDHFGKWHFYI